MALARCLMDGGYYPEARAVRTTITLGGEDDAADYADMARRWWMGAPAARAWVEASSER